MNKIRNKIPQVIKRPIRRLINATAHFINTVKYNVKKIWRVFFKNHSPVGYSLAILCIKKTVYADMLINNVNSLHYLNPNHTIYAYCDTLCFNYLKKRINKFTYKDKIVLIDEYGVADKPWQYYKIEVHIKAAWNDQIDTDADGVWHDDLIVNRDKITMLALAYKIKDQKNEIMIMDKIFNKKEWSEFNHRVAAFLSLPSKFMTKKIESDLRYYNDAVFKNTMEFLSNKEDKDSARRLSEEFAVNLAIQTNVSQDLITELKETGDPSEKNSLQSLYYGCINKVVE